MRLDADVAGLWCEDLSGNRFGMDWDEVHMVSGYKINEVNSESILIVLDYNYGESFQLISTSDGFDQVARSITEFIPGIDPLWLSWIRTSDINDPPLEVWHKAINE